MHGDDERVQAWIETRMRVLPRAHDDDAGRPAGVQAAVAVEPAVRADERSHDDAQEAAERDPRRVTPVRTARGCARASPRRAGAPRRPACCPRGAATGGGPESRRAPPGAPGSTLGRAAPLTRRRSPPPPAAGD